MALSLTRRFALTRRSVLTGRSVLAGWFLPNRRGAPTGRLAVALLVWLAAVPGTAASPAGGASGASDGPVPAAGDPLPALERAARPLRSVDPSGPSRICAPSAGRSATP